MGEDVDEIAEKSLRLDETLARHTVALVWRFSSLGVLILIGVALSLLTPTFLTVSNLTNVLLQGAITGILAIGQTFVIISAGIDLSIGMVMTLASIVLATVILNLHMSIPVGIVAGVLAGAVVGGLTGLLVTRIGLPPFIATLGMMGVASGVSLTMTSGYAMSGFNDAFLVIAAGYIFGIPLPVIVWSAVAAASEFILRHTPFGRYAFAIGGNREAALQSGIDVRNVEAFYYVVSGLLAGVGGVILASRIASAHPAAGAGYELDSIAATVIGGTSLMGGEGSVTAAIIGTLIMATIRNGLDLLGINAFLQQVFLGSVLILAVSLDQFRRRGGLTRRSVLVGLMGGERRTPMSGQTPHLRRE
jgi:ribose/xylose/arabinose/galactoside ABC-type transport system permease subunit